jgi:hypothetical protein
VNRIRQRKNQEVRSRGGGLHLKAEVKQTPRTKSTKLWDFQLLLRAVRVAQTEAERVVLGGRAWIPFKWLMPV